MLIYLIIIKYYHGHLYTKIIQFQPDMGERNLNMPIKSKNSCKSNQQEKAIILRINRKTLPEGNTKMH